MKISQLSDSLTQTSLTASRRTWGFRFAIVDAAAIAAFAVVIAGLHWLGSSLWWVVAIVAVHFFLFCNVFRVIRRRELIWAALFILNVGFWLLLGRITLKTLQKRKKCTATI